MRGRLLLLLLSACAASPAETACDPPEGWRAVAEAAEGGYLIVGETHGSAETPRAFGEYVCSAAGQGGRTLVGLELSPRHQAALDAARQASDPEAVLIDGMRDHWSAPDGRSSRAMLDLIVRLSSLDGVHVHAFDAPLDLSRFATSGDAQAWYDSLTTGQAQQMRAERMRDSLRDAFDGYDRAIVLAGNIHAAKAPFSFLDGADNMAMLLPGDPITLVDRHDAGEMWNVITSDGIGRANPAGVNRQGVPEGSGLPGMALTDAMSPRYDGYLYVGPVTASPPAITP